MPKRTTDEPADPNALTRQSAGEYRTADDRFAVRQADQGWFLVDTAQTNDFGQELMHGPYPSLKVAREAIPGARAEKVVPLRRPRVASGAKTKAKVPPPPPPPPPSWIDLLPVAEGRAVRRLIRALEGEGIADAEALVRRDRDGLMPAVATRLITNRLAALVADAAPEDQERMRAIVGRVAEILTSDGSAPRDPLPRWMLVEIGAGDDAPPNRRIDLGE